MLWLVMVVGILLIFGFWLLSSSARHYKNIFDAPHLIEFAEGVVRVRQGALEHETKDGEEKPFIESDPRVFVSSRGVALTYTISAESENGERSFEHHFAISQAGRPTTHALGEFFSLYVAILLNLEGSPAAAFSSHIGVHHMVFRLSSAEQDEWEKKSVLIPTEETLPGIREEIQERRARTPFETVEVPLPK